ncbi:MAG: copper-binding protein [Candidatus Acidiferrales bacterium]
MQRKMFGLAIAGLATVLAVSGEQSVRAMQPARSGPSSQSSENNQTTKTQRYVLAGTVQSIDLSNHQIVVDGDAVPGYMDAMSMPYSVPDKNAIKALKVGDVIHADLVVQGDDSHLENITVTGHAKPKS